MTSIFDFCKEIKMIRRGENSVSSGFVKKMPYDDELHTIRGEVQASMKKRMYKVEIILSEGNISKCSSDCPRGLDVCHHMAAPAVFAHSNLSVTDQACKWNEPKTNQGDIALTTKECFPSPSAAKHKPIVQNKHRKFLFGFISFLYPGVSKTLRQTAMPIHTALGIGGFILAIVTTMMGITEKVLLSLGVEKYSKFAPEGIIYNFIGLFAVFYGVMVLYMVNELDYKRVALPEDEMVLTGSE